LSIPYVKRPPKPSRFSINNVFEPFRAAATAAATPSGSPPTTMTSYVFFSLGCWVAKTIILLTIVFMLYQLGCDEDKYQDEKTKTRCYPKLFIFHVFRPLSILVRRRVRI
jgi:hypothetical protein